MTSIIAQVAMAVTLMVNSLANLSNMSTLSRNAFHLAEAACSAWQTCAEILQRGSDKVTS